MAKLSKYQTLQKKLMSQTNKLFELKDAKELYNSLSNGQNAYLRFDRFESSAMDMTWIKQIEECMPDLNDIVSNPKRTIQTLSEVVEVEKVKRTSHESVQHLASHTQFVKSIDEEGNVTPSKILNVYNDDFFAIYENKFIATLVRRLFIFVEKRYDYIIHQATLRDVELLYFKNKTNIDGSDIEIETKIRYSKPALDSAADRMKDFLRRIDDIRRYLRFFANSEFMKILRRERDVRNPILQTNIIRKNPKYRNCYHLWQFLNNYMEAGIEVKVEENYSKLTETDLQELNKVLTINFLALKGRDAPKEETKPKIYRPRILKTYDDEMFNPGANFEGPIEFVRVDEKYRQYKETLKDLNPHPTKALAEYEKEHYQENKEKREETKQVDSLIKRKENEYKKYQKEQEALLQKEREDWEMVSDLAEQQIQEEQEEKLQPYRDALAKSGETGELPEEKEEPVEETPTEEVAPVEEKPEEPVKEVAVKEVNEGPLDGKEVVVIEKVVFEPKEEEPSPEPAEEVEEAEGASEDKETEELVYSLFNEEDLDNLTPEEIEQFELPIELISLVDQEKIREFLASRATYQRNGRGGYRPGAGRKPKVQTEEVVSEQPVVIEQTEPLKKKRGGARPGAGRKPKPVSSEPVVKKQRGGARPGAGRKPKPRTEPVVKKQRGGARPGAGRKPKAVTSEPVAKPQSKKEKRLAKKANRKQAKVLSVNTSHKGKRLGRR